MNEENLIEQFKELISEKLTGQEKEKALYCFDIINKTLKEPYAVYSVKCCKCNADPVRCEKCGEIPY